MNNGISNTRVKQFANNQMKSHIKGDVGIDPEIVSNGSYMSPRPLGAGKLWDFKKTQAIRNSSSVQKLFEYGMGVESKLKVSVSMPKVRIDGV